MTQAKAAAVRLGLRANLAQFSSLVLVNAFVGGMVGPERTVVISHHLYSINPGDEGHE